MSVFDKFLNEAWPYRFAGTLHVRQIQGGIPTDDKTIEGWLRSKVDDTDDIIQQLIAEAMVDRGLTADEAIEEVARNRNLNGFKRDAHGLYIEGRQLKAAIKEAASVAVAVKKLPAKWGQTNKGIKAFVAEHISVVEDRLYLGVHTASGVTQRFVHTWRGTGIQYEEYVEDAKIDFTVASDHDFSDKEWAMLWLTGQEQGIGASRSQGYGRYEVVKWERIS